MSQIFLGWILVLHFTGGRMDYSEYKTKDDCLVAARQNIDQDDANGHKIVVATCSEGYSVWNK